MKSARIFLFILFAFLFVGCASVEKGNKSQTEEVFEEQRLFSDWQYSGFGSEYPQWAEAVVLGQGTEYFVVMAEGESVDLCKVLADEKSAQEDEEKLVSEIWVKINQNYEGFENPYFYIKLYSN